MSECKNCKSYFPRDEKSPNGDCVRRESNAKQLYHTSKPVNEKETCNNFEKK